MASKSIVAPPCYCAVFVMALAGAEVRTMLRPPQPTAAPRSLLSLSRQHRDGNRDAAISSIPSAAIT